MSGVGHAVFRRRVPADVEASRLGRRRRRWLRGLAMHERMAQLQRRVQQWRVEAMSTILSTTATAPLQPPAVVAQPAHLASRGRVGLRGRRWPWSATWLDADAWAGPAWRGDPLRAAARASGTRERVELVAGAAPDEGSAGTARAGERPTAPVAKHPLGHRLTGRPCDASNCTDR